MAIYYLFWEYFNGLKDGKGIEYYYHGNIKFEGEYLNGEKWNGEEYDPKGNVEFIIKNGKGNGKEYYDNGNIKSKFEYLNGRKNGKGK